ncbi:hypothetical protein N431DRAFT_471745 [Stipitochalara longipes BDJ]|nr:hypothetical protein N431DRAFT_471745 [Stipitochalara longipes BDJ]
MLFPSPSSNISGDVWQLSPNDPYDLHKGFKVSVQTPYGIASTNFSEAFLATRPPSGKSEYSRPGFTDWMSNQPIKPEAPSPGPMPPPSGPRRQYPLADINIRRWGLEQKLHARKLQAQFHPPPPLANFPGPGKPENSSGGEGGNGGSTEAKKPKSREDIESLANLEIIEKAVHSISRKQDEQGLKIIDVGQRVDSVNTQLDKHEQNLLSLEKNILNSLHASKLWQQSVDSKLHAITNYLNNPDADYTPEPVPQVPFRQVENSQDLSILNAAEPQVSEAREIVLVEVGPQRPTPGRPTYPTPGPRPDREPKPKPKPRPNPPQNHYDTHESLMHTVQQMES